MHIHIVRSFSFIPFMLLVFANGCGSHKNEQASPAIPASTTKTVESQESRPTSEQRLAARDRFLTHMRPQVEAFCGYCHATPSPSNFAKAEWEHEVIQGYRFFKIDYDAGAEWTTNITPPNPRDVIRFYALQAPDNLVMPEDCSNSKQATIGFEAKPVLNNKKLGLQELAAIASVENYDLGNDKRVTVYCDMRSGVVGTLAFDDDNITSEVIGSIPHPAQARPCDLDGDGRKDLVVADLGSLPPQDHNLGQVVWMRRTSDDLKFEPFVLADNIGRVADVRPGDFDGDGDEDLVVGEFGWRSTGSVFLLMNEGTEESGAPEFTKRQIDPRHGAIHTHPIDIDKDGDLDIIVLLSQEHESVELYENDGTGNFESRSLWSAETPSYGSSGIDIADINSDGRDDILVTNGDVFDKQIPRPLHSVQWLENRGDTIFEHHHIAHVPGVHRAKVTDIDGDGDQDVIATVFMEHYMMSSLPNMKFDTVLLLEQKAKGEFERSKLEAMRPYHPGFSVADYDNDGSVDILLANFTFDDPSLAPIEILYNQGADTP